MDSGWDEGRGQGRKEKRNDKQWIKMARDSILEDLKYNANKSGFSPIDIKNLLQNFNPEQYP